MPIKTIQAKDMDALDKKVAVLEEEGWIFAQSNVVGDRYKGSFGLNLVSCLYYATMVRNVPPPVTNLLLNPSFELGTYQQFPEHDNIQVPESWKFWFTHGERQCTNSEILERQPESGLITKDVDAVRVYDGNKAFKAHTFSGCHNMRLYQTVDVEPGKRYEFSIFAHGWYSECTGKPHTVPYRADCIKKADYAWHELRAGIDPLGLDDPESASIVWTNPMQRYGHYTDPLIIAATAEARLLTVVTSSWTSYPLKHEDWYVDAASLRRLDN